MAGHSQVLAKREPRPITVRLRLGPRYGGAYATPTRFSVG